MAMRFYILEKGEPKAVETWQEVSEWLEQNDPHVWQEVIGDTVVTTRFTCHAFEDEQPIYWETNVLGGRFDLERRRCAGSREQAQAMHDKMVQRVKQKNG